MILYNTVLNQGTNTDNHWVPTVHIDGQEGLDFLDFMDSHTGAQASWEPGLPTETRPDVMTSFSSRGPATNWIVPDVTAPGIQILAGHTPEPLFDSADGEGVSGPPGELYQAIAGTSMAAPHATGITALIKAVHPDWTPGQIKSALMTTSVEDVLKEDGVTPADPFDDGAGAIRATGTRATLTMDVDAADYYAAAGNVDEYPNLNTPSIDIDPLSGQTFVPRTFTNSGDHAVTYKVSGTTDDPAVKIVAFPGHFTLDPGESATVQLRFKIEPGAVLGQHFGRIGLNPTEGGGLKGHMPVAFVVGSGGVEVTESCDSTSIGVGESTPCQTTVTNTSSLEANVHAELAPLNTSIVKIDNVVGGDQIGNKSWTFDGTLSPALAPSVDAIATGGSPYGYVSLASLGVTGFNLGDEELAQFDTSDYQFGGESYNVISLVSNGYAIMGDDTSIDFVPQTFPDPVVPNNVLAPFWTDMDPGATDGGLLYVAEVGDGVDNWIVLEWEDVPVFSTGEKQTFQIWVQTDAEFQSFEYASITGSGDPAGLNTGAENRDGSSGVNLGSIPASGDAYHIETSPPAAGGTATITYDAIGQNPGTTRLKSKMTSDITQGTSFAFVEMTVG
jgi:hypothetical protein